ncbi:hypothetical protein R5O87_20450 [Arthrobacter globiformis]
MVSSTSRAPVLSPMSPWAVKWTAGGAVADADSVGEEEGSSGLDGGVAGGPDVPGGTGVSDGGTGGPDWQAVSSNAREKTAGATPDHVSCFDSPVMIPRITELSLIPLQAGEQ